MRPTPGSPVPLRSNALVVVASAVIDVAINSLKQFEGFRYVRGMYVYVTLRVREALIRSPDSLILLPSFHPIRVLVTALSRKALPCTGGRYCPSQAPYSASEIVSWCRLSVSSIRMNEDGGRDDGECCGLGPLTTVIANSVVTWKLEGDCVV